MSSADANVETEPLVLAKTIRAPREAVFEFLVDEAKMLRWMGVTAELDATPGGIFRVDMNGEHVARGKYLEIDPPNMVSFSFGWEGGAEVPPESTTVVITLTEDDEATHLELRHLGLPLGPEDEHKEGWNSFLPNLVEQAEADAKR